MIADFKKRARVEGCLLVNVSGIDRRYEWVCDTYKRFLGWDVTALDEDGAEKEFFFSASLYLPPNCYKSIADFEKATGKKVIMPTVTA